jgi:hypothetical protein
MQSQRLALNWCNGMKNCPAKRISPTDMKPQFILIPQDEALLLKVTKIIQHSQKTIDCITSAKKFMQWMLAREEVYIDTKKKGVMIRYIMDMPETETLRKGIHMMRANLSFKIRFLPSVPRVHLAVFDGKELVVETDTSGNFEQTEALWTDNPSFIVLARDHYESLWLQADELKSG